jgi:signal transduction histidine kinase
LKDLGIQGFHDKADRPDKLLLWIQAALKHQGSIEELQRRERAHRDLIAHASHELRNPLHIICGYGEVLLSDAAATLPAQAQPIMRVVAGKAHGLSQMTSNILFYSQLEAEAIKVVPREIELGSLLRGLPELVRLLLASRAVGFSLDVQDDSLRVTTDGGKVEIILHNLLSNAAKFTQQGSVYLRVAPRGHEVQFVVRDTGIGIAKENLENVFEPFWRVNQSPPQEQSGIGLGLALSRRLASLLGGSLRVTSELGVGSDFTLTLPIEPEWQFTEQIQRPAAKPVAAPREIKASPSRFGFFRPF